MLSAKVGSPGNYVRHGEAEQSHRKYGSALRDDELALGAIVQVREPLCDEDEVGDQTNVHVQYVQGKHRPAMNGTPSSFAAAWWQVPASPMKGTSNILATPTTARASAMSRAVMP